MSPIRLAYVDAIGTHARQTPDQVALIDPYGEYTYGELWCAVGAVAELLRERGTAPGDRVVTALAPGAPYLAALLGIMAAGAVAVPLNTRLTPPEAVAFLTPLRPSRVLVEPSFAEVVAQLDCPRTVLPGTAAEGSLTDRLGVRTTAGALFTPVDTDPVGPAMIVGTGGTTGEPKGATWSHQGLWLYAGSCQAQMEIRRTDVELYFSPFFHIALATGVLSTLYAGGCGWILPRFDETAVLAALGTGRPTRLFGAPTALLRLLRHPGFSPELTASVRRVLYGSTSSAPDFADLLQVGFPAARLITGYGATEFGAVVRLRSWEHEEAGEPDGAGERGLGRAVPGVRIRIVDEAGRDVERGEVGRVLVRAPWQMLGYWGRDGATAFTDPAGDIDSGDLGRLDRHGVLHLAGRAKDMVISGGENVFPIEVENVLTRHPAVGQVAVFGVEDPLWGERVEVAVVPSGATVDVADLLAYCRERLAGYKVPRCVHIVTELPLTAAMKVDKRRLREVTRGT